jgi:uncharacterized repeat protein (TIGR01451 family)
VNPWRLFPKLLACCLLWSWMAAGYAAAPAAGVMISSTAQATFLDTHTGNPVRLNSNTAHTRVTALEALTLTASQGVLMATGAPFAISHTLANTGNTDSTYLLAVAVVGSSGFTPVNLQVVRDANGNGRVDPGELPIAASGIVLAAGASVNLLLAGAVPGTASAGLTSQVVLTASSQAQGIQASNTDTLTLTSGAAVQVVLSAASAGAAQNADLDWTAVAVNNGSTAAGALALTVDGTPVTAFALRLPVPANTSFAAVTASANVAARTLYHLVGSPAGSYASSVPAGGVLDAVAWSLPELPPGGSLQGGLRVRVSSNATGGIADTAYADWSEQGVLHASASNTVALPLPARAALITFYTGGTYVTPAIQNTPGRPLFVQTDAALCNANPGAVDTVPVTLTSQLTGDVETFTGVETGPNTGLFRIQPQVPTANAALRVVAAADGVLEVLRNDIVTATVAACAGGAATATTTLLIDPSGIVYDSRTNQPLAGAGVQLIDVTGAGNGGHPGQPAIVLDFDAVTPAPSSVSTAADGVFTFPLVQPSTYRLRVTPPPGFLFPSSLPPALQPATREIDASGSYGGNFVVATAAVRFDLPLDTGGVSGLFVQKTASKATAEIGDFVDYTVTVRNVIAAALHAVQLRDALPAGFGYVKGSARLNGAVLADPVGGSGAQLGFAIGTLAAGAQAVVSYRVRIGPGSQSGTGINTAQASGGGLVSNRASVRVQVLGGVFANDAYVIGKVYADCRRDGVQAGDEPGVPGVRIYLEDGTYAVTDEEGKYSFYGLAPRTHVAKVDVTTLPAGTRLQVLNNRNAFDGGSRFVDLGNGELHKADFALAPCEPGVREQIAARRKALRNPAEIVQAASTLLNATPQSAGSDARSLPASGALGLPGATLPSLGAVGDTGGSAAAQLQGLPQPVYRPADALVAAQAPTAGSAAEASAVPQPLEELLPGLTPDTGFVGFTDGQALPTAQTRVRVKGPLGARFELLVNGKAIPATQVGKRSSLEQTGVTAWEYIGVDLRAGRNTLEVQTLDPFGNVRGRAQVVLLAPGALVAVRIEVAEKPVADAATPVAVHVSLRDAAGLPVTARTQVTLQASAGQWQVQDADPRQAGTQVMLEGGTGRFLLLPPAQPGKAELTVLAGAVKSTAAIEFVPRLRPLIAAGLVEGTLNLRNLNPTAVQPAQSGDVFEREIRSVSRSFGDGKGEVAAHAAVFLKGKVLGSSLLTLAYDSDKAGDTRLFRDIQPNQFYPVYGDSSARGFDGQSTGALYVLLQNGSNYALLGDFATQSDNPARQLTQYTRNLNGAKGRWSDGKVSLEAFASRTSATQVVQEFRANGTSGPFRLDSNGVVNSEQLHVITRSRNQPALVLQDTPLATFTDYAIEPYTGLLILKAPVPSVDADLNPVFIRVSYDVDAGGPKHGVAGIEANVVVAPGTTVGAVVVRDDDPLNRQRLQGLTLSSRIAEKTVLTAEVARTGTDLQGEGKGQRVELKHEGGGVQARVWGVRTDTGFANTGSPQAGGQQEYGAKAAYSIDAGNRIVGEVLKTSNASTGAQQLGAELKLEHSLPGNARIEVGVRHSSSNTQAALTTVAAPGSSGPIVSTAAAPGAASGQESFTSARVKISAPVPGLPQADAYAVAEQAIDGSGGRELGVGANYAVNPTTKAYVRHDFINSLNGPATLNSEVSRYTTVAGVNTALPDQTQLFNEYRLADAVDGRTAEAAVGLRKTLDLLSGLKLTGSLQRIKPLAGPAGEDSTAVALGAEYTQAADWKASGQAQWQTSATSQGWLLSGAVVNKLDADWTLLNRFLYSDQADSGANAGDRMLLTAQTGFAYRPVASNQWNALGRLEYKRLRDSTLGVGTDESAWMLSGHANYQPSRAWTMSGRYAARWVKDDSNGLSSSSFTQLLGGRSTWDLSERWDAGLQAYAMWGNGSVDAALGVQVGYLAWKNLWLSAGYNFKGFSARDMAGEAHTARGAYLKLRFKFDEALFAGEPAKEGKQ